jgi:ABC-2 type transport system ATP-binding protein
MKKLGKKRLTVHLVAPLAEVPATLAAWPLTLNQGGRQLDYTFDGHDERNGIPGLLRRLDELEIAYDDLQTKQSSLEDIFVSLVTERA